MKKPLKRYEFNGVCTYAHCFCFEIEAKNKKEAKTAALKRMKDGREVDPAMAEFQEYILDEPIEIK